MNEPRPSDWGDGDMTVDDRLEISAVVAHALIANYGQVRAIELSMPASVVVGALDKAGLLTIHGRQSGAPDLP